MSISNMVPARQFQKEWKMGPNKFYELLHDPSFPSIRIKNTFYILTDKLEVWMEEQSRKDKSMKND